MGKYTFDQIRQNNLLLYEYIRGSQCQGTNTPLSDIDKGGIFLAPPEQLLGLGLDYQDEISNDTHDVTWYELQKFMKLLLKGNPTVLEALFVDDEFVVYEHPIMTEIKKNRDKFLTKKCFESFIGFSRSQILKAKGLHKKINWDVPERKDILDFVFTFHKQGSSKIKNWMEYRNLKQQYCGLVNIPNMITMYGVYYDWGNYFLNENISFDNLVKAYQDNTVYDTINIVKRIKNGETKLKDKLHKAQFKNMVNFIINFYELDKGSTSVINNLKNWYECQKPIGYKGMINEAHTSTELRLSSVSKGEKPICNVSYSKDAFSQHCRIWKEYQDWVKHRNPVRYESNLHKSYDCYLDEETEFLTNNGWKKYDDVTDQDLIGTFNNSHNIEFQPWLNRFDDIYNGNIYTFESRYTRFSITPNHKLYISPCHTKVGGIRLPYDKNTANWQLMSVNDYFNNKRSRFYYLNCLQNTQLDNLEFTDDMIKILGLFLSEGTFVFDKKKTKPISIRISQIDGGCACGIIDTIKTINIHDYIFDKRGKGIEHTYEICDKNILKMVLQCNGRYSLEKEIPQFVYTFSKRQFDILLDALICGDGTIHKRGHRIYYTHSFKLAKSLHTLLMLNGYPSQLYGGDGKYTYNYRSNFHRKDGIITSSYQVFISNKNKTYGLLNKNSHNQNCGWNVSQVTNKRIVCFETKYGTLVTRNKNKMAFHGNSKNISHSFRLLNCGIEIARGEGFKVNRKNIDADFLLDVKNHKFEYEDIMKMLKSKYTEMKKAMDESTLPDDIDLNFVNGILLGIRKKQLGL